MFSFALKIKKTKRKEKQTKEMQNNMRKLNQTN